MDFITGGIVIVDFGQKWRFKVKMSWWIYFFKYKKYVYIINMYILKCMFLMKYLVIKYLCYEYW